ncbi:MAG: MHYT domain-containing protein, partial [Luteimonas sp.]
MNGTYDPALVVLSAVVAVVASFVALDLAAKVTASRGRVALAWLLGGALSMGAGIWSMHCIAMLAFRLPIVMRYDVAITAVSLVIAIAASGFALYVVSRASLGLARLGAAALLMGLGIAGMHYTGMAAMQMTPPVRYQPGLFALSILVAVAVSCAALWLAFRLRAETLLTAFWRKAGSSLLMGAAICGMHYTGMAAAIFAPHSMGLASEGGVDSGWLAVTIGVFTFMLLIGTLLLSLFDARRTRDVGRAVELSTRLQAEIARHEQAGEALLAGKEQARAIFETAHDAYVAIDPGSTILEWNRKAEYIFGWSREDAIGRNLADTIIPARFRQAHFSGIQRFLASGEGPVLRKRIELVALHREGHEFPVELT